MRISKIGFVLQTIKKVFSVENGFSIVVTKKCFEVGSKRVLHIKGVSDRTILCKLRWGFGGWGWVWGSGWVFSSSYLLKVVRSDQSVFLHNFLNSQDLSLITLRIALSIPDLHESEGDLQKRARIMEMVK